MKKLIIALDGQHFPKGAFEFAKAINLSSGILLAGVFLSPVDYSKLLVFTGMEAVPMLPEWLKKNDDDVLVSKNVNDFSEACKNEGIEYRIHKDVDMMAISSLIEESRFADALLISSELFYNNVSKQQPNFYLEEVLKKSECPVMLIPENYTEPKHIILTYDGSESSVFAIKQFAYVYPELTQKETVLLSILIHEDDLPEYNLISELVSRHYPNLKLQAIHLKHKKDFIGWLMNMPDSFIVMGAFSRTSFSHLFKKSFAAGIIQEIKMPIFISHK
ncbi:MAG: universal stress protein [Ferruginibacter sp.]|nr:universal stress protein [Bacteroidota bacterium]MBX2919371.1 universal stress protein [Ferruginibacter sp.]